uniref:Alternative protein PPP2R2C n=1 Tax=Homo sapiens TaxID=9606 RepID=L8ECI7_HUMAN|nr:alternative protein PPP2R2C [Homo sapiens]
MTSVWTAWTSPRRSCTRPGTRLRTSLPSPPPTTCTSSRTR